MNFSFVFIMILISIVILAQALRINDLNVENILFGVRVPSKYMKNEEVLQISKRYNKAVVLCMSILFILFSILLIGFNKVYLFLIYCYLLIFCQFIFFIKANSRMKIIKKKIGWNKEIRNEIYVDISTKTDSKKVKKIFFYISLAIGAVTLLITILRLPYLPEKVPVHFGFNGVDRFVDSNTMQGKTEIFMLPLVSIFCSMMIYYSFKVSGLRNLKKYVGGTIENLKIKKEECMKLMNKNMGYMSIGIATLLFYGNLFVTGVLDFTSFQNYVFMIFTIICIGVPCVQMFVSMRKIKNISKNNDGNEIYQDDDENYILGMFYFNPKDPSNVVYRRLGYGIDFNYAKYLGKFIIIIEMALLIAPLVILIFFNK